MDKRKEIINKVRQLSQKKFPKAEIYLFGSQARGEANSFSDWDILVLLNEEHIPFSLETKIMDDFYDLELETGEVISPIIYSKMEWNDKYYFTPLYESINKECVRLK